MIRALLVALAFTLAAPAGAGAAICTDGLFIRATRDADAYWMKRGYEMPAPAPVMTVKEDSGLYAWGTIGGSGIWWVEAYMADIRDTLAHSRHVGQVAALAQVMSVAIHERGHNLGLGHSSNPHDVMYYEPAVPPMARKWARQVVR